MKSIYMTMGFVVLLMTSPLLSCEALKDTLKRPTIIYAFCDFKLNGTKESSGERRGKMTTFFRGDGDH